MSTEAGFRRFAANRDSRPLILAYDSDFPAFALGADARDAGGAFLRIFGAGIMRPISLISGVLLAMTL